MTDNISKEYGVEQFLQDIATASNSTLHNKKTYESITVKGKVTLTKRYNNLAYITLASENEGFSISVRWDNCIDFELPHIGAYIAFKGYPTIQPHSYTKSGLQVTLIGIPIAEYQPKKNKNMFTEVNERTKRITLADWLDNHYLSELLVLGSKTGIDDLLGQVPSYGNMKFKKIIVGNADKFCDDLNNALNGNEKGIIITRGGDDASIKIFEQPQLINHIISKDIPFFTGIGHNKSHLLIEKHCDQAFPTPSAIGSVIESHLQRISLSRKRESYLSELRNQINLQKQKLDEFKTNSDNDKLRIHELQKNVSYLDKKIKMNKSLSLLFLLLGILIYLLFKYIR